MSLQVFTWIPEHPVGYRPRRRTKRYRFDGSDAEQRFTLGSRTKRVYRWPFRVAAASGYREAIDAFLEARSMGAESFLVKDLHDYQRTGISLTPAPDGAITAFSLPTTGQYAGDYPINDAHVKLYRAGMLNGGTLSAGTDARTIITTSAPASGAVAMTGDYWFYRRVCLAQESEEYEWEEPVFGVFRTTLVFEEVAAQ